MNDAKNLGPPCSSWRLAMSRVGVVSLLGLVAAIVTGCSGINGGASVSPLDFFLPGLLQNRPASPVTPSETNSFPLLAQVNPVPP